ncbi:MAG: hypothetical protein ACYCVW_16670 [Rhodocyclaceae bacterium]
MNQLQKWDASRATNRNGAPALFSDRLYDKQAYAAAGQAGAISFFKTPIGQGATLYGNGPKTYADTNMDQAGLLSAGEAFRADFLSFSFTSGIQSVVETVTAAALAAVPMAAQDEETFWFRSGAWFEFKVLSKVWARGQVHEAPPAVRMGIQAAATAFYTQAAAAAASVQITATAVVPMGHLWEFLPPGIRLDANAKFSLTLNWNDAVAMPSNTAGIITAELHGDRMEVAQ